jgi:hypothetical protein
MKSKISILILFFSSLIGYSQIGPNDDAVFIDSLDNIGTEENYKFIRVVKDFTEEKETYDVAFYNRSGKIERIGTTSNKYFMIFEGPFVYYYENGNRKKIETYSDKKINGKQFEWYENGAMKLESEIVFDKKTNNSTTKIINYWNTNKEQKVIDGEGEYEEIELTPDSNSAKFNVKSIGKIKNYVKVGQWIGESEKPKYNFIEQFENGILLSGKQIDSLGVTTSYNEVFRHPKPKNGMDDFYRFVAKNFNTPAVPGLKGSIYATFIVEKDGTVSDINIIKDIGYGTGTEAVRVIQKFNQWIPGMLKGKPVRVMYSLPIIIQSNF